ncbi:DNA repair protein RecO [Flavobacteriaceae bacterium 3-367]|uniref:DNA repair protein RecO n=1 Tax=Eudoraea algarum TaxID=3417568 RepID=UPI0032825BC5
MPITTKAIVLSALKYGDTSLIVKAFTASSGMKTYLLKGVLASKKGKLKSAYFQPLMQLELVANHKDKGTLETIREARVDYHYNSLHTDITKNAMSMFLAEVLRSSIFEEEPNPQLFHFIAASLQWLDTHDKIANFHLYFLLGLTKYLGFYPDTAHHDAPYFDLQEGNFVVAPSLNPMIQDKTLAYFKRFLGTNFDAMHTIKMGKASRRDLLQSLVLYFELHLQGFKKPRSLAILNEVFS